MRKTGATATIVLVCAALVSARPPGSEPELLTLADAVQIALLQNFRVIDSRDGIQQAGLALGVARAEFRPDVTPRMLGSFNDVRNQTYGMDVSQRFTTGTQVRGYVNAVNAQNQLGNFYSTDTTLEISQPFLRGSGRTVVRRALTSAERRLRAADRERLLTERQVAVEVATAYYGIVTQQELLRVAEQTLARSRELLEASIARLEVGRVSRLDVFRAQQLVAQAEGQVLDSRSTVEDAEDQLRFLLGRGSDFRFRVEPDIPEVDEPVMAPAVAVRQALAKRPEVATARASVTGGEQDLAVARNQLLPQLDVNLALTRRETGPSLGKSFGLDRFQLATFVGVSAPFDRTSQQAALQSALMDLGRRRRQLQILEISIERDARRAVRRQDRLRQRLAVADASVDFASQEVELATLRYQRGLSNNLDVVNAESNLLAVRARRLALQAEQAVARLQLLMTLGTMDPRADVR